MAELQLTEDGERTLREAEGLCWSMNVAIQQAEHLLGGALIVLSEAGIDAVPDKEAVERAVEAIHGRGTERLSENVMPGPGMRQALNMTAGAVAQAGGTIINALTIAMGTVVSGEVNPAFYMSLGTSREELERALQEAARGG